MDIWFILLLLIVFGGFGGLAYGATQILYIALAAFVIIYALRGLQGGNWGWYRGPNPPPPAP